MHGSIQHDRSGAQHINIENCFLDGHLLSHNLQNYRYTNHESMVTANIFALVIQLGTMRKTTLDRILASISCFTLSARAQAGTLHSFGGYCVDLGAVRCDAMRCEMGRSSPVQCGPVQFSSQQRLHEAAGAAEIVFCPNGFAALARLGVAVRSS